MLLCIVTLSARLCGWYKSEVSCKFVDHMVCKLLTAVCATFGTALLFVTQKHYLQHSHLLFFFETLAAMQHSYDEVSLSDICTGPGSKQVGHE